MINVKFRNISKIRVLVGTFCDVRGLSKTKKKKPPRVLDSQSKRTKILMYELVRTFVFAWISTFPAVEAFLGSSVPSLCLPDGWDRV